MDKKNFTNPKFRRNLGPIRALGSDSGQKLIVSDSGKKTIALILALISILLVIPNVRSYSPDLNLKWDYDIGGIPREIYLEDLNNDGSSEFVFVLSNGIYVIDSKGNLVWKYSLDDIRSVSTADINNDFYKEIVVSSGNIAENIARGWIRALDRKGQVLWKFPPSRVGSTTLMQDIKAVDIDNNGYYEIIGGSIYGISALKDTYDGFLWYRKLDDNIERIEIANLAPGKQQIIANSFSNLYLLDLNGMLIWNYTVNGGIKTMRIADVYGDGGRDILLISKKDRFYILNSNGGLEFETAGVKGITATAIADLDSSYEKVLVGSNGVVYALDSKFQIDWKYKTGGEITGIYVSDIDKNGEKEVLTVAGDKIHEIDKNGNFFWEYNFGRNIDNFVLTDSNDFIVNSGSRVYVFSINRTYINKRKADSYYELAYEYFNLEDYKNTTRYSERAILFYSKVRDVEGIIKSRLLSLRIESELRISKIKSADKYYENAERYYNGSQYYDAKKNIEKAIEIYDEVNEKNKLSKSREFLDRIENATMIKTEITTTTTTLAEIPKEEPKQDYRKLVLFAIPVLLVIVLIIIIFRTRKTE